MVNYVHLAVLGGVGSCHNVAQLLAYMRVASGLLPVWSSPGVRVCKPTQ